MRDPWGTLLLQRSWTAEAALLRDAGATSSAYTDHRFLLDGVGSVVGLADADAAVVAAFSYDPFGQLIESTGEADLTPFRFTSAYADPTGLLKMGERYYDPSLGRFTQPDPVYDPLDPKLWNRYVYVGNDPVNFVDPSGLSWQDKVRCFTREFAGVWHPGFDAATIRPFHGPPFQGWEVDLPKVGGHVAGFSIPSLLNGTWRVATKAVGWVVTAGQGLKAAFDCRNA